MTSRGRVEDKLEWVFKLYDIDGSGSVDRNEMTKVVSAIVSMNGPIDEKDVETRVEKLFKLMDTVCKDVYYGIYPRNFEGNLLIFSRNVYSLLNNQFRTTMVK